MVEFFVRMNPGHAQGRRAGMPGSDLPIESDARGTPAVARGSRAMSSIREKIGLFRFAECGGDAPLLRHATFHIVRRRTDARDGARSRHSGRCGIHPPVSLLLLADSDAAARDSTIQQELRDVAFGFGLIVVVSSVAFLFWPTMVSTTPANRMLRVLLARCRAECMSIPACVTGALLCSVRATADQNKICATRAVDLDGSCDGFRPADQAPCRHRRCRWSGSRLGGVFRAIPPGSGGRLPTAHQCSKHFASGIACARDVPDFSAMTWHDGRKRAAEFAIFVSLAATGFLLSIWARSPASTPVLAPEFWSPL